MSTLFRFEVGDIRIAIEGSEDFVREEMGAFLPLLGSNGSEEREDEDGAVPTLRRWYERMLPPGKNPTMQDHILIFAYYLHKVRRQFVFTPNDMKLSFRAVGRDVPRSLLQIMGSLKRDHRQLWPGDKRGEYCLLTSGIQHVEKILGIERAEPPPPPPEAQAPPPARLRPDRSPTDIFANLSERSATSEEA